MLQLFLLLLVFLGTLSVLVGAYVFVNRRSLAMSEAAIERLREIEQDSSRAARNILRDESVSDLPLLDRVLAGRELTDVLAYQLLQAGSQMSPGSFLLRTAISTLVGLIVGRMVSPLLVSAFAGAVVGALIPLFWLRTRQRKRLHAFQEQLPDAIDMLVSAMKAGYSFQAAMKFIGEEVPAPLGPEFARFYEEQRLGMEVRTAILALQERITSLDLRMFCTAVLIQRETGGNLGEVLEKISGLMRERAALKGEIETLTAESKLSARILGALPFVVFAAVNVLNPGFMRPMLETSKGPWVMFFAAVTVGIGYWFMMRIADIEI